jgi:site-specific recombinase XerD
VRRATRIGGVPAALRPAVQAFEISMLADRERSKRAGTRPRSDATIERRLGELRSLAVYLDRVGINDWSQLDSVEFERWASELQPAGRGTRISCCRPFFAFARRNKLILVDPTAHLRRARPNGFSGRTVPVARQRELFLRWTSASEVDCNEALVGLLALIHGASPQELANLLVTDIDHERRCISLGRRPHPVPVDPASWNALTRCLKHRTAVRAVNPHVIVTRGTRAWDTPASTAYLAHILDTVGLTITTLRGTRLVALANTHDPNLVAAAYGMSAEGVLAYFADRIDPTLLADL